MKKQIISALMCAALLSTGLCACSSSDGFNKGEVLSSKYTRSKDAEKTYNYRDGAAEPPTAYNSYANLIMGYELKLFRNYAAQSGGSFVFSPASNALSLSLIANGAKGDTLSEITLALGNDLSLENLNTCSSYFKSRLETVAEAENKKTGELSGKKADTSAFMRFDDALFINNNTDVKTAFLQSNADFYGAQAVRFDFAGDAKSELDKLFNSNKAADEIPLDKDGSLVSADSVSFCDGWLAQYGADDLSQGKFGGKDAVFMKSTESFIHSDAAQGIIKYTAKNPLKLVLIMPNENVKIDDYIKTFDTVEYMKLLESFNVTSNANASVPQFDISAKDKPEAMAEVMQKTGLYTLFSDKSDFGNLAHTKGVTLDGMYSLNNGFSLSKNGVSTASDKPADSALAQGSAVKNGEKNAELVFNRPFIFMLIDNESNIPVYSGVYMN